ncbi:UNVERIFIED_CONTAM: hypothetical protein K2H54_021378 [Gekko kuhli]
MKRNKVLVPGSSEGLRKDGDHSSSHKRERKVERKKKEASPASSDPGEEQQSQGGGQEKEEEGISVASEPGEKPQNQDEDPEEEGDRDSESANPGEEQRGQEDGQEGEKQEGAPASSEPEEEQRGQDESQEKSPSPSLLNTLSEGVDKGRLAQLRSQLQAQFSIREQQEDPSPGSPLVDLVGRIVHGEGDDRASLANREGVTEGQCPTCGQCSNPAGCSSGLPAEVGKALQRELAVLKGEVTASIESMRREVAEELSSLREAFQVFNEHHFLQATDLSPLEELDENVPNQLKGGHPVIPQAGKPGDKIPLEEQFKSRSVPTLHPLPISSRNQAMLRAAMTTITAKSGFGSNLSRSNSDPVEPMQPKSTIFPPAVPKLAARKPPAKMMPPPTARTYASNGKYSNKMPTRTLASHPPCGDCEGKPH